MIDYFVIVVKFIVQDMLSFGSIQLHKVAPLQDEEFVVFPDIRPAAPHHYLVLPRQHITDAKCLTKEHISLGEAAMEPVLFLPQQHVAWFLFLGFTVDNFSSLYLF